MITTPSSPSATEEVFHNGERLLQAQVGVRDRLAAMGPALLRDHMPDQHRELFGKLPTLLLGALDTQGQPWATMVSGSPGFVQPPDTLSMHIRIAPDAADPVLTALEPTAHIGILGLEPHTRRRNRLNGRVRSIDAHGLSVDVVQSFGNCPKYIQAREPQHQPRTPSAPQTLGPTLSTAALELLARCDTLFIASASAPHPGDTRSEGVDISHRGGEPGFVHVEHTAQGIALSIPDYPGNRFFNTLGNLLQHPRAGLLAVDYDTGGLLHVAVNAQLLPDMADRSPWPGAERALRFTVRHALWREHALPMRWTTAVAAPQFRVMREHATD